MYSDHDTPKGWVAPFGHPRIKACSRLPMAFRSVPRPSSPPGAKASTECPSHTQSQTTVIRRQTSQPSPLANRQDRTTNRREHMTTVVTSLSTYLQTPLNTAANQAGRPLDMLTHTHDPFRSDNHPASRRTHPHQHPNQLAPAPIPTELLYAPRDAPEPDSQHKRTMPPGLAQQHTQPRIRHPTLSGATHTAADRRIHPMKRASKQWASPHPLRDSHP